MVGVTVLQALVGFDRSAHVHRRHVLEDDQSLVIEIVDEDARLRAFVASLTDVTGIALMTLEVVEIVSQANEPGSFASELSLDKAVPQDVLSKKIPRPALMKEL